MLLTEGADEIIDYGNGPEIFAHDLGDAYFHGENVHMIFIRWRKIGGILQRCFVAEIIRPIVSLPPGGEASLRERFPKTPPNVAAVCRGH